MAHLQKLQTGLTAEALEQEGAYNSEVAAQNEIATKSVSESTKSTRSTQSKATSGVQQLSAEELAQRRIDRHAEEDGLSRMPRNVQAYYLQPLRRVAEYGIPSCDLQLRSYSIRPLEFFCDFALRAAYYLGLPAYGPVPLPKIIERWTVPKSNFIFKKSQENFERITRRRLIQIKDGNPETVQIWLAFLQKHQQAAVGLKANIWEFSGIDVAKELAAALEEAQPLIDSQARFLSQNKEFATVEKVDEVLQSEKYRLVGAQYSYKEVKLSSSGSAPVQRPASCRVSKQAKNTSSTTSSQAAKQNNKVIFSGIQPTGIPHLGNYLGALKQWVSLQDGAAKDTRLLFSIVDLHALTVPQKAKQLREQRRQMLAALLAVGVNPERSSIFYQSSVPAHAELMWILSCTASMGYLSRMTQWKSKLALSEDTNALDDKAKASLKLGLFSYPVLQAADIMVHRATHVPVGEDQRQHIEFARECAKNFNATHNKADILLQPETILSPARRIMSLTNPTAKMSKSEANPASRVLITDEDDVIRQKLRRALTDSLSEPISYNTTTRPGVANLLEILSILEQKGAGAKQETGRTPAEIAVDFASVSSPLKTLKERAAEAIIAELRGVRESYNDYLGRNGGKWLDEIESAGAQVARENANRTMKLVKKAIGFY
ncbi:putative tryptophanyl-tRNA synthetase [Coniella lustricola]|uniref:Small ribosomal subunit protein uS10m n=1 Tax=Coniella lustricola TaxID=2025994 RepID=A0A2T3AFR8_9PEZI|nr:putative tryptophanyl-tRNA synthetase [Coniella lustricola]